MSAEPVIEIVYRKGDRAPRELRRLTPRELRPVHSQRYLVAYDHDRGAVRTFRVHRIERVTRLKAPTEVQI